MAGYYHGHDIGFKEAKLRYDVTHLSKYSLFKFAAENNNYIIRAHLIPRTENKK